MSRRRAGAAPWPSQAVLGALLVACGPVCPVVADAEVLGTIEDPDLDELSGLARGEGWWWAHNDGAPAEAFALDGQGQTVGRVSLRAVQGVDFEDIAVEQAAQGAVVWLADIGDNEAERPSVWAYGFAEPAELSVAGAEVDVQAVEWRYPDGVPRDAETLLIDPISGDRVVVTRGREGAPEAFSVSAGGLSRELSAVVAPTLAGLEGQITGGDLSSDGRWIALRSGGRAWLWLRSARQSLSQAWSRSPVCEVELAKEEQGEAIAFGDGGLLTGSEGEGQPLHFYPW